MTISLPRTERFTRGVPGQFTVSPDGATVLFLRSQAGDDPVSCLWGLDTGSGVERLLADPAELLGGAAEQLPEAERIRRERNRQFGAGIVGYATDEAVRLAAFALSSELWTVTVLLIHGLTDDNVFPANTLRLSSALLAAGRPHEVLPLSGATHHVRDETAFENLHWHQVRFLQQHLGVKPPGATGRGDHPGARSGHPGQQLTVTRPPNIGQDPGDPAA